MPKIEERIFRELKLERDRRGIPANFPAFPEIPGGRYTRQDFFDLEIKHVFKKSWVMVGHIHELPEPGSYKRFNKLMGSPILLIRGLDQQIRAFYNTCRHRGAPVVKDESGRCNLLRCQYHSWTYGLDGRLVQVPDQHDFPALNKSERGLLPVRCEVFKGLIFINEDQNACSLQQWLGPLADEWSWTGLEKLTVDYRWSRVMNCNWKCAIDAFEEVYHINTLHPKTVGTFLDHSAATMGLLPGGHSRMCVRYSEADIDNSPAGGWPEGEMYRRANIAHTMWPSLIVPWREFSAKFIRFWPLSIGQCEIEVLGVGRDWGGGPLPPDRQAANDLFDSVLMEDVWNLEAIQSSLNSGAFTGMMLNYQERRIYWSHENIDRAIGAGNVPAGLEVKPVLESFVERSADAAA